MVSSIYIALFATIFLAIACVLTLGSIVFLAGVVLVITKDLISASLSDMLVCLFKGSVSAEVEVECDGRFITVTPELLLPQHKTLVSRGNRFVDFCRKCAGLLAKGDFV